jgi:hypothetical protein
MHGTAPSPYRPHLYPWLYFSYLEIVKNKRVELQLVLALTPEMTSRFDEAGEAGYSDAATT